MQILGVVTKLSDLKILVLHYKRYFIAQLSYIFHVSNGMYPSIFSVLLNVEKSCYPSNIARRKVSKSPEKTVILTRF